MDHGITLQDLSHVLMTILLAEEKEKGPGVTHLTHIFASSVEINIGAMHGACKPFNQVTTNNNCSPIRISAHIIHTK